MLSDGDKVTAIDFAGIARESVVVCTGPMNRTDDRSPVAYLPECAYGDHSACRADGRVEHGYVAFLDSAQEGVHYALGWDTPEALALKAVALLGLV